MARGTWTRPGILSGIVMLATSALPACRMPPANNASAPAAAAVPSMQGGEVPIYEWDPCWPQLPLPNKWGIGNVAGLDIDEQDNVWILQRPRTLLHGYEDDASYPTPESECCIPAPAVIEFNQKGEVVQAWGGPGSEFDWPQYPETSSSPTSPIPKEQWNERLTKRASGPPLTYPWPAHEHGLTLDPKGFVWIGNSNGSHILKMTRDGRFVTKIGRVDVPSKERGSKVTDSLHNSADLTIDAPANEVYVADGYGNRRVIVFDSETGAYKRHWGAYGKAPDDSVPQRRMPFVWKPTDPKPQQFNIPHSIRFDKDGLVYVADRENSRLQVFKKDGTYVKETYVSPTTPMSVLTFVFSRDPEQRFVFIADGRNDKVRILRRSDLHVVGEFGSSGHFGGQFSIIHTIAVDSRNNIFTTETIEGKRVQRFAFKGMRPRKKEYDEYGLVKSGG